jgi:hypothetical protein
VRVGLVAVGTAFAVVGAAVIVGITYPSDIPTVTRSSSASVVGLSGGEWKPFVLPAFTSDPATLTLSWSATAGPADDQTHVNVSLYSAYQCPPATEPCHSDPAIMTWNGTGLGRWSDSRAAGSLYLLFVDVFGPDNSTVNFTATFTEQYRVGPLALPIVPFTVTMVGGGLLTGIGAVALYLGLFLPRGVYAAWDEPEPLDDDLALHRPADVDRPEPPRRGGPPG